MRLATLLYLFVPLLLASDFLLALLQFVTTPSLDSYTLFRSLGSRLKWRWWAWNNQRSRESSTRGDGTNRLDAGKHEEEEE